MKAMQGTVCMHYWYKSRWFEHLTLLSIPLLRHIADLNTTQQQHITHIRYT